MNDIWYLGDGFWMVYVDNIQVADDFASIIAMQYITTYYNAKGKRMAVQFKFFQGHDLRPGFCLLHYACRTLGLDYSKVFALTKSTPGVPYGEMHDNYYYQSELFKLYDFYEPERTKRKIKKEN